MHNFPLIRDARSIELDILDLVEASIDGTDLRPTLRNVSNRVGVLADSIAKESELDEQTLKNAERWKLLFETPGVVVKKRDGRVFIFRDAIGLDGSRYGRSILSSGDSIRDAVDRVLGFIT